MTIVEDIIDEGQAKPYDEYPSATNNREYHQRVLREMDMIRWDKLRMKLETVYANGRVRLEGTEQSELVTEVLNEFGYEYRRSRVIVEDYEITHVVDFMKESDSWR